MLDGSNPPAFEALTEEWAEKSPLFFTINDLGWDKCKKKKIRKIIFFKFEFEKLDDCCLFLDSFYFGARFQNKYIL